MRIHKRLMKAINRLDSGDIWFAVYCNNSGEERTMKLVANSSKEAKKKAIKALSEIGYTKDALLYLSCL